MAQSEGVLSRFGQLATLVILSTFLVVTVPVIGKTKKASDYFNLCHQSDPEITECVKKTIQESREKLGKGIPELKLPPLDPMHIPAMELREGSGNFLFVLKMTNMNITGLRNYVVKNVSLDLATGQWNLDLFTPEMHFESEYEMSGKLLALPIQGKGRCTFDFKGVKTVCDVKHSNITKNGKVYNKVDSVKWDISVELGQSHFTNLFNGDKTLGDSTNTFLNQNWKEAFETYKHLPEEAFAQVFIDLDGRFFDQFPLDELYPA